MQNCTKQKVNTRREPIRIITLPLVSEGIKLNIFTSPALNKFMKIGILISFFFVSVFFNSSNGQTTWTTYHLKYGYSLDLPYYFSKGGLTASSIQYFYNSIDRKINLTIESLGGGNSSALIQAYGMDTKRLTGIQYESLHDTWYVISGSDKDKIYYYKTILVNNLIHYLRIEYPTNQKPLFDSILPRISKSFK